MSSEQEETFEPADGFVLVCPICMQRYRSVLSNVLVERRCLCGAKLWRDFNQEIRELLDRSPMPLSELVVEIRRLKELQRASIRHPDADSEFR